MGALYLNVKTVPAIDPEHHHPHTAYTVFTTSTDENSVINQNLFLRTEKIQPTKRKSERTAVAP